MFFTSPSRRSPRQWMPAMDFHSLWFRLTIGVAAVFALGLGGVTAAMYLQIQRSLILSHKQEMQTIAARFPRDVEIFSSMGPLEKATQQAIDELTENDTWLWVKAMDGTMLAQSAPLALDRNHHPNNNQELLNLSTIAPSPELREIKGRYWLMCATDLQVKNQNIGKIYLALDITDDQKMFLSLLRDLGIATFLAISSMIIIIALYVRRSLQPLHRMTDLTQEISAERLNEVQIQLGENAPSEVQQLAHTFEQMLTRLSESWDHQRQLVSNVSHELRTPLTVVSGYLQSLLRRGQNLTPPQREALEIAAAESERTIQLLQDLLDLARADSGNVHYKLQSLALQSFLAGVAETARNFCDRPIIFESESLQSLTIKTDPNRLKQVLLNLIDNAVKYSDEAQSVTIRLRYRESRAMIQVCDRGLGIPLPDQMRIFDRFYRVDEARSRVTGGIGLGLSIVKTLVVGMGGEISVESQLGKGSTFTVTFPATVTSSKVLSSSRQRPALSR